MPCGGGAGLTIIESGKSSLLGSREACGMSVPSDGDTEAQGPQNRPFPAGLFPVPGPQRARGPRAPSKRRPCPSTPRSPAPGLTLAEAASLSLPGTGGRRKRLDFNKTDGSAGAVQRPGPG